MRQHTRVVLFAVWLTLLAAYGASAQPTRATALPSVSPAHCIAALERRQAPDPLRCPSALRSAIVDASATCRDAGGNLTGAAEGNVWSLDVDDDGRLEVLFELDGNVSCTDAWSLFSCGSLGCPKELYELRDGMWTVVGRVFAAWPEQITLGSARAADGHRSLEVCPKDGCPERWIYEWQGDRYDATRVDVRGTRVQIAAPATGPSALAVDTTLRATPAANGADVGRYAAGTDVAIIGTAGDWYYVSPCNACESGFIPRTAL